jgi:hypothetical protein
MVQIQLHKSAAQGFHVVIHNQNHMLEQHLRNIARMMDLVPNPREFLDRYIALSTHEKFSDTNVHDAFSQGQIDSKLWLIDTLITLDQDLGRIWILCGWIGSLSCLMFAKKLLLNFTSIRSFDIDPACADLADILNREEVKNNWMFKASTADVMDLRYDDHFWYTKKFNGMMERDFGSADTVINTSCEHLEDFDTWIAQIPKGKLVILQCSSHESYDGHVNSMDNIYEMVNRSKLTRIFFKGTLRCYDYDRHMLIGKK